MKFINNIINSINEFVTKNSELIDNWNNFFGILASLFAIVGVIFAIIEYYINYRPKIKAKAKVGTVCIAKDFTYFFAIVVTVQNKHPFKIIADSVFIEVWPRRAILLEELDSLPNRIEYNKSRRKNRPHRKTTITSSNFIERNHIIEERSSKRFYITLNEQLIKNFMANKKLNFLNLHKRIYIRIETANGTYKILTPYTIKKLLKAEQKFQSNVGNYNYFDVMI